MTAKGVTAAEVALFICVVWKCQRADTAVNGVPWSAVDSIVGSGRTGLCSPVAGIIATNAGGLLQPIKLSIVQILHGDSPVSLDVPRHPELVVEG